MRTTRMVIEQRRHLSPSLSPTSWRRGRRLGMDHWGLFVESPALSSRSAGNGTALPQSGTGAVIRTRLGNAHSPNVRGYVKEPSRNKAG
jgi:hypothetical protein